MSNLNLPSDKKYSWMSTEGAVGLIILIAIITGIAFGINAIFPILIEAAQNIWKLVGMCLPLAILVITLLDGKNRRALENWYLSKMRNMRMAIYKEDPIGALQNRVDRFKKKRESMNNDLTKFSGEKKKLENQIKFNQSKINENLQIASSANDLMAKTNDQYERLRIKGEADTCAQQAGLLKDANAQLTPIFTLIGKLYDTTNKLYINSEFLIRQLENEVVAKRSLYESIKSASKVVDSAKGMYGQDSMDEAEYAEIMQSLNSDVDSRLGMIERFMDNATSITTNIDIRKGAYVSEGLKMLEEFENKQFDQIFNKELGKIPAGNNPQIQFISPAAAQIQPSSNSGLDNLI